MDQERGIAARWNASIRPAAYARRRHGLGRDLARRRVDLGFGDREAGRLEADAVEALGQLDERGVALLAHRGQDLRHLLLDARVDRGGRPFQGAHDAVDAGGPRVEPADHDAARPDAVAAGARPPRGGSPRSGR